MNQINTQHTGFTIYVSERNIWLWFRNSERIKYRFGEGGVVHSMPHNRQPVGKKSRKKQD